VIEFPKKHPELISNISVRSNAERWVAEIRIRIESNAGLRRTQIIEHSLAPGAGPTVL